MGGGACQACYHSAEYGEQYLSHFSGEGDVEVIYVEQGIWSPWAGSGVDESDQSVDKGE